MHKRIYLTIFLFIALAATGQDEGIVNQSRLDSLRNLLPGAGMNHEVDLLNEIASIFAPINFDSSITYSVQAQRIASIYGYPAGVGRARLYTGNAYYYKMDLKNALLSYLAALKILEDLKPEKELGDVYIQLGNINFFMGRTDHAISSFNQAAEVYRIIGKEQFTNQVYYNKMVTYLMNNQFDSALFYGNKFLEDCRRINDRYLEAHGLNVMGWIYSAMKDIHVRQKSIECMEKSLEIGKELKDETLIAINNLNQGNNYDHGDFYFDGATLDLPLARTYYNEAYKSATRATRYLLQGAILNYIAAIDIEERKYEDARAHLQLSEKYLDTLFRYPTKHMSTGPFLSFGKMIDYLLAQQQRIFLYDLHFKLCMAEGYTDLAIDYLRLYYQYSDSLYSQYQAQQFELLMTEADAEKTDQKIRSLAQENELSKLQLSRSRFIFAGVAAIVVIISLALLLFFQRKRLKAEQISISMEQRLLRAQMNPHFLFNSLASIQNYIINENTDQASIYLSRFSQLVRNILDSSAEEYVSLEKEIETIQNYLELQKVRYAGKFDFNIEVDDRIDEENMMIPPMLAQPFIENSIEHGVKYRETMGHIEVRFRLEDGLIRFEVEDDGVGRERAHEIESKRGIKHRSMATSITVDRLASINKKLKRKIRMEIIDLKDASGKSCGTKVTFGIPVVFK